MESNDVIAVSVCPVNPGDAVFRQPKPLLGMEVLLEVYERSKARCHGEDHQQSVDELVAQFVHEPTPGRPGLHLGEDAVCTYDASLSDNPNLQNRRILNDVRANQPRYYRFLEMSTMWKCSGE